MIKPLVLLAHFPQLTCHVLVLLLSICCQLVVMLDDAGLGSIGDNLIKFHLSSTPTVVMDMLWKILGTKYILWQHHSFI